ncbi:hypothetical protein [Shinella zoogloeoides]|uniref:hypothetical protein n=1 Tax=Shinella zoogloeoides TaxID=352475 RepID=UPI00299D4F03|nr:hypothetical protein [Shinella zoogloeoides]WPE22453.1 hypothetical protein ShzoTeo12_36690 [Shinella zoogloeoides]
MGTSKFYIVWNGARNEGFITDDISDAKQAFMGRFRNPSSTVGEAFYAAYDDDVRGIQAIEIEPIPAA